MVKRRHALLQSPGSASFITTTIVHFVPILKNEALAAIVLDSLAFYIQKYTIKVHGFVIMPTHLHLLITGEGQKIVSQFTGKLKEFSAKEIIKWCLNHNENGLLHTFHKAAMESKQGHMYQVWQKGFDNVAITSRENLLIKLNYIHNNPLQERWNLCENTEDYHFSSAENYLTGKDDAIPIVRIQ